MSSIVEHHVHTPPMFKNLTQIMYVDIRIETLRQMLREELIKILDEKEKKEKENDEKQTKPPLSIPQLADRYGVSKATVHNWRKKGLVTGFKVGKGRFFHVDEVEKNLKQYRYWDVLESKGLMKIKRMY